MKYKVIIILVLISGYVYSGCESSVDGNLTFYGNKDIVSHSIIVNNIASAQQCDWTFLNVASFGYITFLDENLTETWTSAPCLNIMEQETFSTEELIAQMRMNPYYSAPGGVLDYNDGRWFTVKVRTYHGSTSGFLGVGSTPIWYEYYLTIFHAEKVDFLINEACAGLSYDYDQIIDPTSVPVQLTDINIVSEQGDMLNQVAQNMTLSPTFSGYLLLEFSAIAYPGPSGSNGNGGAITVYKEHQIDIGTLYSAEFNDVANNPGPLLSSDPLLLMSDYVQTTGGNLEFMGGGVVYQSGDYYFDPSVASSGSNLVAVRTESGGCISAWRDTIFEITPTVVSFNDPVWDVGHTFNGDNGSAVTKNVTGVVEPVGVFHFGCQGVEYSFKPSNHLAGLTLEYKIIYHTNVLATGSILSGDEILYTLPNNVNTNQQTSIYDFPALLLSGVGASLPYNMLMESIGGDYNNNGVLDSDDYVYSNNLGDEFRLVGRYVNVLNQASDWSTFVIGVVPNPYIEDESVLCFEGNPVLSPVTDVPIYHDSVNYDSYRSVIWDVNMDGIPDLDGSVDNVNYTLWNNTQKEYQMTSVIVDSVKVRAFSPFYFGYVDFYKAGTSEVCYSNYDTVRIVRNPDVQLTFDTVGQVAIGDVVTGNMSGDWFSVVSDTLLWQWSDGSPLYSGEENVHFMNDLGYYNLYTSVEDSYGCKVDSFMVGNWLVTGVLNLNNTEAMSVKLFPVPVENILNISIENKINSVLIIDQLGVVQLRGEELTYDLSDFSPGVYHVVINTENNILTRKIIKL